MNTLATAFALAGIAVAAYGGWLAWEQQRLRQRLDALEAQAGEDESWPIRSRAA